MGLRDHILPQPPSFAKKKEYTLEGVLGTGSFGKVIRATWHKAPPPGNSVREVALKVIPKKNIKGNEEAVFDEIEVLKGLDHPGIVKCFDHFESRDKYYLVFELAVGGELFDKIASRGKFTEKDATEVIKEILSAVQYLHEHDIVHRDLKPENILYRTLEERSTLVIADFGVARHLTSEKDYVTSAAGSFGYAAPEVLLGKPHGKPCDVWSLGIIAYVILCGYQPFRSEDPADLVKETMRGRLDFHERYWKNVSDEAKDFIKTLVNTDAEKRPTATQALQHPWLSGSAAADHDLGENIKANYVSSATSKLRSTVHMLTATRRMRSSASTASTNSSGFATHPPTPSPGAQPGEGQPGSSASSGIRSSANKYDSETDTDEEFHTADEQTPRRADFPDVGGDQGGQGLKRTDGPDSGAVGQRLDALDSGEGDRLKNAAQEEDQLKQLHEKTAAVEI